MVVKVVVKNKYQLHFTIICTAASGPEHPHITVPLIAPLHSWRINPDQKDVRRICFPPHYESVGITEKGISLKKKKRSAEVNVVFRPDMKLSLLYMSHF